VNIRLAATDSEILACFPVMKELRPDLVELEFVAKIRALQQRGFMLAYLEVSGSPVAVTGFRVGESLAWKQYLYVEDLVTLESDRSKGYGKVLLDWLADYAKQNGCIQFHLDSGVQRIEAHRFYEREGMQKTSLHFAKHISFV